jgi:hypothetical protein
MEVITFRDNASVLSIQRRYMIMIAAVLTFKKVISSTEAGEGYMGRMSVQAM